MTLPTGSNIFRAEQCPPSCAYPQVNTAAEGALIGTAGHGYLQRVPKLGDDAALEQVPEKYRDFCSRIELEGLPLDATRYTQEATYAFDVATGEARFLGAGLDRQYPPLKPTELVGTIDVCGGDEIYDYKFDGYESHSPPPDDNPQLFFPALCRQRIHGLASFKLALIHFRPDGSHWVERASREIDAFDLDAFALRLRRVVERVRDAEDKLYAGKVLNVHRGAWCRYCPSLTSCPAVLSLIHAAAADPQATTEEIQKALQTPGDLEVRKLAAAKAYQRLQALRDVIKPLSQQLYLFASEHELDLGEGRVYGSVERLEEVLDAKKTRQVLASLFGGDVAEAACEFTTSKAAVERSIKPIWNAQVKEHEEKKALGDTGKKPTLVALKKKVLCDLEKLDGIEKKPKRSVRVHRMSAEGEVVIESSSSGDEDPIPF